MRKIIKGMLSKSTYLEPTNWNAKTRLVFPSMANIINSYKFSKSAIDSYEIIDIIIDVSIISVYP